MRGEEVTFSLVILEVIRGLGGGKGDGSWGFCCRIGKSEIRASLSSCERDRAFHI